MRIIRDLGACPQSCQGAAIALGNFDGVHAGHKAILRQCIDVAKKNGTPSAVMTFEPHPREFFAKGKEKLRICSLRQKLEIIRDAGIDLLYLVRFNQSFSGNTAESFVKNILVGELAAKHVVTGYNFAFGKGRSGNVEFLQNAAKQYNFGFTACKPVHGAQGEVVSSSAIRTHLAAGEIHEAAALLGHPYVIRGRVRHGDKRGRELGFPTANIAIDFLFKPRFGIYAVRASLDGKRWHDAVASLGIRPTFSDSKPLLEVYVFDMDQNLYGQPLYVEFADFIRDEIRFDDLSALRAQIEADCGEAKRLLGKRKAG